MFVIKEILEVKGNNIYHCHAKKKKKSLTQSMVKMSGLLSDLWYVNNIQFSVMFNKEKNQML